MILISFIKDLSKADQTGHRCVVFSVITHTCNNLRLIKLNVLSVIWPLLCPICFDQISINMSKDTKIDNRNNL